MSHPSDYDYPCSATWRGYYNQRYGYAGIDYDPHLSRETTGGGDDTPPGDERRLDVIERRINTLFALAAMRQLELTELAQRRHKPRY